MTINNLKSISATVNDLKKKFDKLETEKIERLKKDGRANNGGKRSNSGRKIQEVVLVKKGIRKIMDDHANEEIMITITNPKTLQKVQVKKPRSLILLEDLFIKAHNDKDVQALREWFDRAIGKPAQPIRGDGDDNAPIRIEHDINSILEKVYEDD